MSEMEVIVTDKKTLLAVLIVSVVLFACFIEAAEACRGKRRRFQRRRGKWVSPDGFSDPFNVWTDEACLFDDDVTTFAHMTVDEVEDPDETYLYLTFSEPVKCCRVRFWTEYYLTYQDMIQIDVLKDGVWVWAYYGTPGFWQGSSDWTESRDFGETVLTMIRVRVTNTFEAALYRLYEVDVLLCK